MYQAPLPKEYAELSPEEADARIAAAKATLGKRLVILGHHYQRDEIIKHADYRGDSYRLAKNAASHPEAEFIVFCGVHFMAESADILTGPEQKVILPNLAAGCSMADMANIFQVRNCWKQLESVLGPIGITKALSPGSPHSPSPLTGESGEVAGATSNLMVGERGQTVTVMPITYINSAANLKAFVGEHGGTVCTSSNADKAVSWALERADKVLFFPDQHLGRNTGIKLGYDAERDMALWDPFKPLGGNDDSKLRRSKFLLWKGHCSVHKRFTVEQIEHARREYPGIQVIVHPECEMDVVLAADMSGSTERIVKEITESPAGSRWAVGTEINLVSRLAKENPDKTVFCLDPQICPCSTMYRIHPTFLCWTLERLVDGEVVNQVIVPDEIRSKAKLALDRMLSL